MKLPSIHKALNLPSPYRVVKSVSGHDTRNGFANAPWFELRMLLSETLGTVPVFALSKSFGPWEEITSEQFQDMAFVILGLSPRVLV